MHPAWLETVKNFVKLKNKTLLEETGEKLWSYFLTEDEGKKETDRLQRIHHLYKERNLRPRKSQVRLENLYLLKDEEHEVDAHVRLYERQTYQQNQAFFDQEERAWCQFQLVKHDGRWLIKKARNLYREGTPPGRETAVVPVWSEIEKTADASLREPVYDRGKAVRYAEAWWDRHNSKYRSFDVDCTNYVSQCLHAGGIPMRDTGRRDSGWWYRGSGESGDVWSFSWAVAHSLCWYLLTSRTGLRAEETSSAEALSVGDVICYDFDGNGHWQHNTIVVAKDEQGMPLVNAHTSNVRHRYWDYRDSYAWTSQIQYKFFHILT